MLEGVSAIRIRRIEMRGLHLATSSLHEICDDARMKFAALHMSNLRGMRYTCRMMHNLLTTRINAAALAWLLATCLLAGCGSTSAPERTRTRVPEVVEVEQTGPVASPVD